MCFYNSINRETFTQSVLQRDETIVGRMNMDGRIALVDRMLHGQCIRGQEGKQTCWLLCTWNIYWAWIPALHNYLQPVCYPKHSYQQCIQNHHVRRNHGKCLELYCVGRLTDCHVFGFNGSKPWSRWGSRGSTRCSICSEFGKRNTVVRSSNAQYGADSTLRSYVDYIISENLIVPWNQKRLKHCVHIVMTRVPSREDRWRRACRSSWLPKDSQIPSMAHGSSSKTLVWSCVGVRSLVSWESTAAGSPLYSRW